MAKRRGSAIIIAIFIVAAVTSVVLGVGRLMFAETTTAYIYERGQFAYYAAESGIEEGFLRYRYERDTTATSSNSIVSAGTVSQSYDLSVNSRSQQFGDMASVTGATLDQTGGYLEKFPEARIIRDEAKKFRVDLSTGKDIDLAFHPLPRSGRDTSTTGSPLLTDQNCVLVEIKIVGRINSTPEKIEHKQIFRNSAGTCSSAYIGVFPSGEDRANLYSYPYSLTGTSARINTLSRIVSPDEQFMDNEAELYIKPIGSDIAIAYDSSAPSEDVYAPKTEIVSTGKYDGLRRKLAADIDRQSGTLYDLFDYVIYSATNN